MMSKLSKNKLLINEVLSDERWLSVLGKDASADDSFYYAVKTTGVYCMPSCGARTPRPENIQFYLTQIEAQQAGFRPCLRCKPDRPSLKVQHTLKITAVCQLIASTTAILNLNELAAYAEMSPYYFHRIFKEVTGLTPRAYSVACREQALRNKLIKSPTITDAIYDAGYQANSRFYEKSNQILGMTPTNYRTGGKNAQIHFAVGECMLGHILVASSQLGVCAILMGDNPEPLVQDLQKRFPRAQLIGGDESYEKIISEVIGFVEAPRTGLNLPLDIRGTVFQKKVWQALRDIPVGNTASYTEIANSIGFPKAVRAVAGACAANVLAVAIPCHRVIRNDGNISGYRWGIERKKALIANESDEV